MRDVQKGGAAVMGTSESIRTVLHKYFSGFDIPVFLESQVESKQKMPYLTYDPEIPGDWNESAAFHARLWYPSANGNIPILQMTDEISASLHGGLTLPCEGGAIILCKGSPWAQSMDNPPEGYLCTYLNFELTQLL